MDGVLCDFEGHFLDQFKQMHPEDYFIPLVERHTFYAVDKYKKLYLNPEIEKVIFLFQANEICGLYAL